MNNIYWKHVFLSYFRIPNFFFFYYFCPFWLSIDAIFLHLSYGKAVVKELPEFLKLIVKSKI